jgi:hypothetical protein
LAMASSFFCGGSAGERCFGLVCRRAEERGKHIGRAFCDPAHCHSPWPSQIKSALPLAHEPSPFRPTLPEGLWPVGKCSSSLSTAGGHPLPSPRRRQRLSLPIPVLLRSVTYHPLCPHPFPSRPSASFLC